MKSPGIPINVNGPLPRKYREWIRHFVNGEGECLCAEYSHLMKKHYPELTIMDGDYDHDNHAWCQTPNGLIVDPTIAQFTTRPRPEDYHGEPRREVLDNCPHCGGPLYLDWILNCTPFCYGCGFQVGDIIMAIGVKNIIMAIGNDAEAGIGDSFEVIARRQVYSRTKQTVVDIATVRKGVHKVDLDLAQYRIHRISTGGPRHERALQNMHRSQV